MEPEYHRSWLLVQLFLCRVPSIFSEADLPCRARAAVPPRVHRSEPRRHRLMAARPQHQQLRRHLLLRSMLQPQHLQQLLRQLLPQLAEA